MDQRKDIVDDFGGQYPHLITRRCRELGVYTEIVSQDYVFSSSDILDVGGVILSGRPRTVTPADLNKPLPSNLS